MKPINHWIDRGHELLVKIRASRSLHQFSKDFLQTRTLTKRPKEHV